MNIFQITIQIFIISLEIISPYVKKKERYYNDERGEIMGMGVKVKVWGDYALFSRPELKVERYSYDVITPSAEIGRAHV